MQNLQVLRGNQNHWFAAEFHSQKYPAKGSLNARTFARHEDRLRTCLDSGSEAGCAVEGSEKSRLPEDLPRKSLRLDSTAAGISTDARPLRPGDTIVVWKLDRLARSTRDLLNTMETIHETGGKFQSISEPWANTTAYVGKMIMTVFAGIAEFERDLIRERTGAGREAAKQRGVRFGRPRKPKSRSG